MDNYINEMVMHGLDNFILEGGNRNDLSWKYVDRLKDNGSIKKLEQEYKCKFPADLKKCIISNNGGTPSLNKFDTQDKNTYVFSGLLSLNEDDNDNIYSIIDKLSVYGLIPFGSTPFGNFICTKNNSIVYWNHETNKTESVANSFTSFLDKLY